MAGATNMAQFVLDGDRSNPPGAIGVMPLELVRTSAVIYIHVSMSEHAPVSSGKMVIAVLEVEVGKPSRACLFIYVRLLSNR